jgi:prepilin-type N-terminal cleavage/methylation domain-containing protein
MPCCGQKGFTLFEIVITLVVAAILATLFMQFMGTSLSRSTEPLVKVQEGLSLGEVMEKMSVDYKSLLATDSNPLDTFKSHVENGNIVGNTPYFGSYSIETKYISFTGGTEVEDTSGENRVLKVIIGAGDQTLVALFTK